MLGLGNKVIPVRLSDDVLKFIEELVELGIYSSRSEALRDILRIGIENMKQVKLIAEAANKLFDIEREEGEIPIRLNGALRKLLDERGRF